MIDREDIIRMAREANIKQAIETPHLLMVHELERFAKLVAADEREACAKVAENRIQNAPDWDSSYWDQCCSNVAFAIRARGQQ